MTYAHWNATDSRPDRRTAARPRQAWVQDAPDLGHYEAIVDDDDAAAHGIYPVILDARPADTATDTADASWTFDGTVIRRVWTARPKTADELAADADATEDAQIRALFAALRDYGTQPLSEQTAADVKRQVRQNARVLARLVRAVFGDDG